MADSRSHPIRQLLDVVAMGHQPSTTELDALNLEADQRTELDSVIKAVSKARESGDRIGARRLVTQESPALIKASPTAGGWEPPPTDPSKLADSVPRW